MPLAIRNCGRYSCKAGEPVTMVAEGFPCDRECVITWEAVSGEVTGLVQSGEFDEIVTFTSPNPGCVVLKVTCECMEQ